MRVNRGGFGDEQSTRGAGSLSIILESKVTMNVVFVCPEPRHRTENDTMLEVHTTDTDRSKEFRQGHFESGGGGVKSSVRNLRGSLFRLFIRTEPTKVSICILPEQSSNLRRGPGSIKEGRALTCSARLFPGKEKKPDGWMTNRLLMCDWAGLFDCLGNLEAVDPSVSMKVADFTSTCFQIHPSLYSFYPGRNTRVPIDDESSPFVMSYRK